MPVDTQVKLHDLAVAIEQRADHRDLACEMREAGVAAGQAHVQRQRPWNGIAVGLADRLAKRDLPSGRGPIRLRCLPGMSRPLAMLHRLRTHLVARFFGNFFRLLIFVISLAQAVLVWWLWPAAVSALGIAGSLVGAAGLYAGNRSLMRWTAQRQQRGQRMGMVPRL